MSKKESVTGPGVEDEANFVESIKRLREEKEWTQADLARAMSDIGWTGIYQTTVSRIENGSRPLRMGEARGIAKALGVPFSSMLAPIEETQPIRDLERRVRNARASARQLDRRQRQLETDLEKLRPTYEQVVEHGAPEWATAWLREHIDRLVSESEELLGVDS